MPARTAPGIRAGSTGTNGVGAPAVAIIIAARNEEALIGRAVRSALRQGDNVEVVVIDDGSTDRTSAEAEQCDDGTGRVRVLRFEESRGPGSARNHGIARSTAPLICVLDADDYMLPGRIEQVLRRAGDNWDFVADDIFIAAETAPHEITGCVGIEADLPDKALTFARFLEGNLYNPKRGRVELGFLKPIMRRGFLRRAGISYDGALRLGEDFTLYAEALAHGARFKLLPACGYVAVQRKKSLSSSHSGSDLAALANSDNRLLAAHMVSPSEEALLRRHRDRLINRAHHNLMLEAKQDGRWRDVFASLLRRPASTVFILRETFRLKLAGVLASRHAAWRA